MILDSFNRLQNLQKYRKMLQLGTQFPIDNKDCNNVRPKNGAPMYKRQRTCEMPMAIPQMPNNNNNNFKTHLCANFRLGHCGYGNKCRFAHGVRELIKTFPVPVIVNDGRNWNVNNLRKLCKMFHTGKVCTYGDNCRFLHGSSKQPSPWVKTKLCNSWELNGSCQFGNVCLFAHGQAELGMNTGSIQMNTTQIVSTGKAGIWTPHNPHQQVQSRNVISKPKTLQKLAGIYADWIEDRSFFHNLVNVVDD